MLLRNWKFTTLTLLSCASPGLGQDDWHPQRIRRTFSTATIARNNENEPQYHLTAEDADGDLILSIINGANVLGSFTLTPSVAPVTSVPSGGRSQSPTVASITTTSPTPAMTTTGTPSVSPVSQTEAPSTAEPVSALPTVTPTVAVTTEPPVASEATLSPTQRITAPPTGQPTTMIPVTNPPTSQGGAVTTMPSVLPEFPTVLVLPTGAAPSTTATTASPSNSAPPAASTTSSPVTAGTPAPVAATAAPTMTPSQPCNMSSMLRTLLLRVIINNISDTTAINTDDSPQNNALMWITEQDADYVCPDDDARLIQRYSLAVFYYSTRGDRWTECAAPADLTSPDEIAQANNACTIEPLAGSGSNAWLTPGSECAWGGVVCNDQGIVERIDFESNGLSGTIASELGSLTALRFLLLEDGVMSGTIPKELGGIESLEILDLNFNLLGGSIPEEIFRLTNLRQLDLNDNLLEGTISSSVGLMQSLSFLQLQNNRISGTVPSSLGLISALGAVTLEENNLEGTMPQTVCLLREKSLMTLTSDCLELSGPRLAAIHRVLMLLSLLLNSVAAIVIKGRTTQRCNKNFHSS